MHELSIVSNLFEILEEKAREQKAKKIIHVKLKVGQLSGVVPEFLESAFNIYKKETIAAEASLEIEKIALKLQCKQCKKIFSGDDIIFICPECSSTRIKTLKGTELILEKIGMETD